MFFFLFALYVLLSVFNVVADHLHVLFGEIQAISHFWNWFVFKFVNILYIFWLWHPHHILHFKYFHFSVVFLFIHSNIVTQKLILFWWSLNYLTFLLSLILLISYLRINCQFKRYKSVLFVSSKSFTLLLLS